jgi:MSHA biogenesis protein MshQ
VGSVNGFTYIGQAFNYTTAPVITVTAQNSTNNTTTLYADATKWWRITNASLTGKSYTAAIGTLDVSGLPGTDPVIVSTGAGVGTLTFSSGAGLFFTRTTPTAPASPYDADISLAINVIDADGVAYATNPARFGTATAGNGIAFSDGNALTTNDKQMRFGRLWLQNANGSELLRLPIPMETQFWNGTGFVTNIADNCTNIDSTNVGLGNFQAPLAAATPTITPVAGAFVAGRKTITLAAPGAGNNGAVTVAVNLGSTTTIDTTNTCLTSWTGNAPAAANLPYLRGQWCGANYDRYPTVRATFGIYRNTDRFIYQQENY